jgi:hypothetical protein
MASATRVRSDISTSVLRNNDHNEARIASKCRIIAGNGAAPALQHAFSCATMLHQRRQDHLTTYDNVMSASNYNNAFNEDPYLAYLPVGLLSKRCNGFQYCWMQEVVNGHEGLAGIENKGNLLTTMMQHY